MIWMKMVEHKVTLRQVNRQMITKLLQHRQCNATNETNDTQSNQILILGNLQLLSSAS
jgi:hypothetical protein